MQVRSGSAAGTRQASVQAMMRPTIASKRIAGFGNAEARNAYIREVAIARKNARATSVQVSASSEVAKTNKPMNIVFISTEVAPWSKTGGLGDVVGGLPIELAKRGHKVMSVAPRYDQYFDCWDTSVRVNIDGEVVGYFHTVNKGVDRVFIDHPYFLAKIWGKTGSKLYSEKSGADFMDNHKRFTLFSKAALEAARVLPCSPGEDCVFVINDWHSAPASVLLKDLHKPRGEFTNAKSAFCIHNIAFQGRMWPESFYEMNMPAQSFEKFAFEDGQPMVYNEQTPYDEEAAVLAKPGKKFQKINWMKAGIVSADKVLTVSPNYASEIMEDAAKGVELDSFLRAAGVEGIVNGMDIEEWDPSADKLLDVKYDASNVFEGKAAAKAALQQALGLPVDPSIPLFAFIGRLEEQKGTDILLSAIPKMCASGSVQVAVLGTGKPKYEKMLKTLETLAPGSAKGVALFSAPLAHMMTAGADFFLVPSRFEPCGLIQLHAMHYGTVPLVSSTGGLVDTVKEGITGFHMGALDPDTLIQEDVDALAATVGRACDAFTSGKWKEMVKNCISQDLSWSMPAMKWEAVLEEMVSGAGSSAAKKASIVTPVEAALPGPGAKKASPTMVSFDNPITRTGGVAKPDGSLAFPAPKATPTGPIPAKVPGGKLVPAVGGAAAAATAAPAAAKAPAAKSGVPATAKPVAAPAPATAAAPATPAAASDALPKLGAAKAGAPSVVPFTKPAPVKTTVSTKA